MSKLNVLGVEIVQSIQNPGNEIPLVAGKRTFARVYLDPDTIPEYRGLVGYLNVTAGTTSLASNIASTGKLISGSKKSLAEQRLDWSSSLNFLLPDSLFNGVSVPVRFQLTEVKVIRSDGSNENKAGADIEGDYSTTVNEIVQLPEVHCRILLFRHRAPDNRDFIQPALGEVKAVNLFVENAFPVGKLSWSCAVIAAPRAFRALNPVLRDSARTQEQLTRNYMAFFQHMLAIRERDILLGGNSRSLYLGMISDPSGRFGGAAMDSPQFAAPHVVALTTADSEGQLGAHELAHVLGRRHPGVPDCRIHGLEIGQKPEKDDGGLRDKTSKSNKTNPHGYLSNPDDVAAGKPHLGFDFRFNKNTPEVLPHDQWFDLMTYRYPKWVSDTTYLGLLERLGEIYDPGADFGPPREPERYWTVIGEYDLKRKTGRIFQVMQGAYPTPVRDGPVRQEDHILKLSWDIYEKDESGKPTKVAIAKESVNIRDFRKLDGSTRFGVFQHTLGVEDDKRLKIRFIDNLDSDGDVKVDDTTNGELLKALRHTMEGRGWLSLLVDNRVVDAIGDFSESGDVSNGVSPTQGPWSQADFIRKSESKRIIRYFSRIMKATVKGGGAVGVVGRAPADGNDENEFRLQYSIKDGGYYLRYHWQWPDWIKGRNLRVIMSIACRRKRKLEDGAKLSDGSYAWETIGISIHRKGRIWISPVYFDDPQSAAGVASGDAGETEHGRYGEYFPGGDGLIGQCVELQVGLTVGFKTVYSKAFKLRFTPDACKAVYQQRDAGKGFLPYSSETKRVRKDRRTWYRDTHQGCDDD